MRQKLDDVLSEMESSPVLLFHQRQRQQARVRLCLDDVLSVLEQHALHHEPDEALIREGYVTLPTSH